MEDGVGGAGEAVISQRLPDGRERPRAHMSRRLTALGIMQMGWSPLAPEAGVAAFTEAPRQVMHLDN